MTDRYLTVSEAARKARRGRETIRRWMREGRLTKYKTGHGQVLIRESELDDLLTPRPVADQAADRPGAQRASDRPGAQRAGDRPGAQRAGDRPGAQRAVPCSNPDRVVR